MTLRNPQRNITTPGNKLTSSLLWNIVFGLTMLVYIVGLFIPIMEPDAAVYAQVSMEMHDRGDYLSIYHKGADWLDKPHFPFWMSALSYEVFGVNAFAYKLPAVFFVLLGAFYTYLFAKKYYSALHGWLAVILLITAEHIIISNQDVRAEPFMTGLMIMGLYHLTAVIKNRVMQKNSAVVGGISEANSSVVSGIGVTTSAPVLNISEANHGVVPNTGVRTSATVIANRRSAPHAASAEKPWLHLILGSLALACLIMTKGLFTIIPIASGIGLALLYEKNWREIFHWRWLAVVVLTFLFMTPAIYGYYQQFDKHPEKTVFGENNVSGVEFFLWTSQWGRFTNTGPIKGKGDLTFFIHTMLWAFLPWAFAAFFALFNKGKQLIKKITTGENYTFFGFITLFVIFSLSRFQLSFYLNPLFPFLSILTVAILLNQSKRILRIFSVMHMVLAILLVLALIGLHSIFMDRLPRIDSIIVFISAAGLGLYLFFKKTAYLRKIVFATALVVLGVNYYLNRDFYPELLEYQAESVAARYMQQNQIPAEQVVFLGEMESIADVILHKPTKVISIEDVTAPAIEGKFVFTSPEGRAKINSLRLNYSIVTVFDDFPVTRLTGKFINKSTRQTEVQTKYLLKVGEGDGKPPVEVTQLLFP